jgi:hypothetical protein
MSLELQQRKGTAQPGRRLTLLSDVDASVYAKAQTPAIEQPAMDVDAEIAARVSKIRRLYPSDRYRTLGEIAARMKTMERNIERGYTEWQAPLEIERRVYELAQIGIFQ